MNGANKSRNNFNVLFAFDTACTHFIGVIIIARDLYRAVVS